MTGLLTRALKRSTVQVDTKRRPGCRSRKTSARRDLERANIYPITPIRREPDGLTVMSYRETKHLRVLIANERKDRLALVAPIVVGLGHEVIAREIDVQDVGPATARERPDVALVGLGESSEHALELIDKIVREAACPVIVLLHARDPEFISEASKRGVFAHISDADVEDWQSAIDIVLRRFAEYQDLQGAFGRRALTERAKGILMERHGIDEASAFEMLRQQSRIDNRKLIDLATAVVDGHRLLPREPQAPAQS
jgi:AmiR/NasT family two-component response regulator